MARTPENKFKNDPNEIEGVKNRDSKAASFPWIRVSFFILVCGAVIASQGPLPRKIWNEIKKQRGQRDTEQPSTEKGTEVVDQTGSSTKPEPVNESQPDPVRIITPVEHTSSSSRDIKKMSKGFSLETKVTLLNGKTASEERVKDDSYVASYELKVNLPKPSQTISDLGRGNPQLEKLLPGLKGMLNGAKVSPFFYQLYENKTKRLKLKSTKLDELMTRHNFYDCETMLELKSSTTGRKVLLVQAEMDVVSDGSDGDRLPTMPDKIVNSTHYQPMTSYGWRKLGNVPNPLIAGWKKRIQNAEAELAKSSTTAARATWLRGRVKKIKGEIQDMEARSYLIADYDPFIVMPINMILAKGKPYAAKVGDYAVVVYKDQLYPCIVGDAGPSFKVGEASLRMAKQLNPQSSSYSRPVSDLAITYLVFPRTADKFGPPDYMKWHERCSGLLEEIGGIGPSAKLHKWENTLPVIEPDQGE